MRGKRDVKDSETSEDGGRAKERQRQYRVSRGLPPIPEECTEKPGLNSSAKEDNEENSEEEGANTATTQP